MSIYLGTTPVANTGYDKANTDLSNLTSTGEAHFVKPSDLATCQVVIETYRNGSNWYRVYSDGWVEQGGNISMYSSGSNITLHKKFSDTNYNVSVSFGGSTARDAAPSIYNKTTSLFKVIHEAGLNNGFSLYWEAKGMGA